MRTIVIIPAYNEADRVGETVRSVLALEKFFLLPRACSELYSGGSQGWLEVIVVDDGSTDGTADAAVFAGATVLRHYINRGQGAALQTGAEWALARGADCVVHFDADGQFDARDIIRAVNGLQESGIDVILGSRALIENNEIPITKRYLIHPVARIINWAFTGLFLSDVHNGFRALSRHAVQKIVIEQDKMAHSTEIINHIRRNKLSFEEMPVKVKYDEYGQGIRGGFRILGDLLVSWFA